MRKRIGPPADIRGARPIRSASNVQLRINTMRPCGVIHGRRQSNGQHQAYDPKHRQIEIPVVPSNDLIVSLAVDVLMIEYFVSIKVSEANRQGMPKALD